MQAIDTHKQELAQHEQAESTEAERLEELSTQLEQAHQSLGGRLDELQGRRRDAAAAVDHKTITLFDRLSERYDGEVLAEVERPNPRRDEFLCAGCHMSLRAEVANTLKSRDEIVTCKSCGRILFIHKET